MNSPIKNLLVGLFILTSIGICVTIILFLKPTVGDGKQVLNVRFSDIGNLNVGTRVLFAGKPIGEVESIEEIHDARLQPTDELGRVYFFQLTLKIDSHVKVYNTDEVSISTSGLMGEKSISITPKAPPIGVTPQQITHQPIYANSVDLFQNTMIEFSDLATSMEDTFGQLGQWMKEHGQEVAMMIRTASATMEEAEQAIAAYNKSDIIEELKVTAQDIAAGRGTLGRLIHDSDLYLEMNAVLTKANTLMNDINHYGLLFDRNKQWQRTHLKKLNELDAIKSPQEFQAYFQGELSDINASLGRLSTLIESKSDPTLLKDPAFRNDFADLLKKANQLTETLQLYNEYLADIQGN